MINTLEFSGGIVIRPLKRFDFFISGESFMGLSLVNSTIILDGIIIKILKKSKNLTVECTYGTINIIICSFDQKKLDSCLTKCR